MGKARGIAGKRTPEMAAVRIPVDLRQRAKVYAAKSNTKLQAVLADAVDDYLKKRGA